MQRNFKHWLEYHCGLANDRGAVNFMRMLSLNDPTSDNYRSFTCLDGQQFLLIAMSRDKRFLPKPDSSEISIDFDETTNQTSILVPSADPERFTEVEIELELDADGWFELTSDVFMIATIEAVEIDNVS